MKREEGCRYFHLDLCGGLKACPVPCQRSLDFTDFFGLPPALPPQQPVAEVRVGV